MGLAFMCAEKILGLFKKRVRTSHKSHKKQCGNIKQPLDEEVDVLSEVSTCRSLGKDSSEMMVYVPSCYPHRQMTMSMDYPPAIPISLDGEEGYLRSQLLLQKTIDPSGEIEHSSLRPPPNITISNRDPPLSRSQSVNLLTFSDDTLQQINPITTRHLGHLPPGRSENQALLAEGCYSASHTSSNNNIYPREIDSHTTTCMSQARHSRNSSDSSCCANSEAPPPYCDVISNLDVFPASYPGDV